MTSPNAQSHTTYFDFHQVDVERSNDANSMQGFIALLDEMTLMNRELKAENAQLREKLRQTGEKAERLEESLSAIFKSILGVAEELRAWELSTARPKTPVGEGNPGVQPLQLMRPYSEPPIGDCITLPQAQDRESTQLDLTDSIELIASPFHDFAGLLAFHRAISKLPEVVRIETRGLIDTTLRLRLHLSSPMDPTAPLAGLPGFSLQLQSVEDNRIEVLVRGDKIQEVPRRTGEVSGRRETVQQTLNSLGYGQRGTSIRPAVS